MSTVDRTNRRVIHATCRTHAGPVEFTNVVVTREPGRVVMDPHVDQSCVIWFDDNAARELHETLGTWLG